MGGLECVYFSGSVIFLAATWSYIKIKSCGAPVR